MLRLASCFVVLTSLLPVSACQDSGATAPVGGDAGDAARDSAIVPPDPEYECQPNLPSLETGIFRRGCAFINCHTSAGFAGSLDLTEADLQNQLVGVDAILCPSWKRVVPGSPEKSFLWNKLTLHTPSCGARMPLGLEPLPQHALDCVHDWISGLPSEQDGAGR
jgi:hypothetical protein